MQSYKRAQCDELPATTKAHLARVSELYAHNNWFTIDEKALPKWKGKMAANKGKPFKYPNHHFVAVTGTTFRH